MICVIPIELLGHLSGVSSIFNPGEMPKVLSTLISGYLGTPFDRSFIPIHARNPTLIANLKSSVSGVISIRYQAYIFQAIVRRVTVDMIYLLTGPLPISQ